MDKQAESRRQFESEFKRQYCNVPASRIKIMLELYNRGTEESPDWGYRSMGVQNAWEWWQVSRASIVVELPDYWGPESCDSAGYNEAIDECSAALRSIGLSIKVE